MHCRKGYLPWPTGRSREFHETDAIATHVRPTEIVHQKKDDIGHVLSAKWKASKQMIVKMDEAEIDFFILGFVPFGSASGRHYCFRPSCEASQSCLTDCTVTIYDATSGRILPGSVEIHRGKADVLLLATPEEMAYQNSQHVQFVMLPNEGAVDIAGHVHHTGDRVLLERIEEAVAGEGVNTPTIRLAVVKRATGDDYLETGF